MTLFIILWMLWIGSGIVGAYIVRKAEGRPMPVPLYLLCIVSGPVILIGSLIELMADWKL